MSPDDRKLLDKGVTVYTGPIAAGTKFHKRDAYSLKFSKWKGTRVGLYSYNTIADGGVAHFDYFKYTVD